MKIRYILTTILFVCTFLTARGWSEHPLLIHQVLKDIPQLQNLNPVEVKSLLRFLREEEKGLETFFAEHEAWARQHLPDYAPRPDQLDFQATGIEEDLLQRFFYALRLNPHVKMQLYLHLLPNEDVAERPLFDPRELTTLSNVSSMQKTNYVILLEGDLVSPFMVLRTATDEPDYGFDLGLFEDNNTNYGKLYGFGEQSFGNPNLEYSSQAPFHMGFYHEAGIVYFFGPFLKRTYPEYRIHLFKSLAEYAFENGQDYWGWRFMGWGMHYLNDMSMPYHTKPLPGVSALSMIWKNLKAIIGFKKSRDRAVQLVSNRHTVFEEFQWQVTRNAYLQGDNNHPFFEALRNPVEMISYSDEFVRKVAAKQSVDKSKATDRNLARYMPEKLVRDPDFEVSGTDELEQVIELTVAEKGVESAEKMTETIAGLLRLFSMHARSYTMDILERTEKI
jgi:hypothetical protein